ncbi:hypothetical protein QQF64_013411 [Cirrhinus molitorella]|uniref:Uncharacterized protein n=1 Tax=Cirrhinus molitorella TaxID=172907 RepID=A0ABR3LR53_9TELE
MWCLLRLLPLMIGDLVPQENKFWELLLLLLNCMEYIFSPALTQDGLLFLKHLINEHHSLFLELFPERHLKPKHHFILHYPHAIRRLGPLVHYWSMRFEAKHGFFKRLAHITCNFKNICKTMAFRHQMLLCYSLLSEHLFTHHKEVGPGCTTTLASIEGFDQVCHRFGDTPSFTEVYLPSWVKWKGTEYCPGMTLLVSHSPDGEPQFGTIQKIVVFESVIKFSVRKWDTVGFERHYFAYCVIPTTVIDSIDIDSIDDYHPLHVVRSYKEGDSNRYVSMRYRSHDQRRPKVDQLPDLLWTDTEAENQMLVEKVPTFSSALCLGMSRSDPPIPFVIRKERWGDTMQAQHRDVCHPSMASSIDPTLVTHLKSTYLLFVCSPKSLISCIELLVYSHQLCVSISNCVLHLLYFRTPHQSPLRNASPELGQELSPSLFPESLSPLVVPSSSPLSHVCLMCHLIS